MELETVLYRVEGPVAVISLNRTKAMNSLNKQIFADLTTAFNAAKDDAAVRCVVMNGEGRAFCAGGDIAEMKTINTAPAFFDFMTVAGEFTTLLNTFPKPVIAAAHGAIAGAGTSLVMGADIALVADNAMFIVAFGQVGLIPDCACHYLLPRVVGPNRAKELMLTQRAVKADEMLTLGIANKVVPADQLMEEAMKLANKIAIMYLGKIVEFGPAEDIFRHPRHPYTRALFDSIPTLTTHGMEGLRTLEGQIPSPINPPAGCAFHQRCPYATEACAKVAPQPLDLGGGHTVSCLRSTELEEALKETN